MKRSRAVTLTGLMAGTAISISACDGAPPAATQWGDQAPAAEASAGAAFKTLADCESSGKFTADQCQVAFKEAEQNAPKFGDQQSCEARYGVDQCVPRSGQGGSFFTPLLTGFIIGQALNGMGGYGGAPMYRDRNGSGGYYGGGYGGNRDYVTGRTRYGADSFNAPSRMDAPARVQSRSSIISRGGFGGGMHGFGG